ncbi:MAG: hypothetical protein DHS20C15_06410 [Planctomycetota bacterium]|nr:MAG: hypothetical protein DHS20C15_06410 [Planctomycetota bacterium]
MFMLQLAWFSGLVTLLLVLGAHSRAAFGDSVLGGSAYVAAWGVLLVLLWAHAQRARLAGQSVHLLRLALAPALLAGLGVPYFVHGDGGIVGSPALAMIPVLGLLICPTIAGLSALKREWLRVDPPGERRPAPRTSALLLTLAPCFLFACVAAALTGNAPFPELEGVLAPNGLRGILFGELVLWGLPAALLIGSGLDALDGSEDGPLTAKLVRFSIFALLLAAALRPFPSAYSARTVVDYVNKANVSVELPVQGLRVAAPLMLLTLAGLLRRDLRALGRGESAPSVWSQVLLLAGVGVGGWFLAPQIGTWFVPALAAAACALVIALRRLSARRAAPPTS